ncbi:hypothetical protein BGZ75_002861 [Mortierella antarctica]|nr:hypothetical protein BGZ75_002861 [Mortierella antarctica]
MSNFNYTPPVTSTNGHHGHLSPEQSFMLRLFWGRLYEIFDGKALCDQTIPISFKGETAVDSSVSDPSGAASKGWLTFANSSPAANPPAPRFTGSELYNIFWKLAMMSHPDRIVLKYLRARKWVLDESLKMFLNSFKWRIVERLDELSELSDVELDAKYTGFIDQMRSGKGYIRGGDALGRPISFINARQHHKADQPAETIHRYTLYTMECGRTLLPEGVETVVILFDLSDFGLNNMDWGFIRLFVQCFESYYPETLAQCIIHRAPYVFWGIWKLIEPLLDPVVTKKFVFTSNNEELHQVIPREHLPITHYDGLDDWNYSYVPPAAGENDLMNDTVQRQALLKERHGLQAEFDAATRAWIDSGDESHSAQRDEIAQRLREQYSRLAPVTRATSLYQRWGVLTDGKVNWNYNVKMQ